LFSLLVKQTTRILQQNKLKKLLLGVSGGSDSVFLFHLMLSARDYAPSLGLEVAHLNHNLRGLDSDSDLAFVQSLCQTNKIPCHTNSLMIANLAGKNKQSLELAARAARFDFFKKLLKKHDFDALLLGHNANDQAETILFNLTRGCGIAGLAGMQTLDLVSGTSWPLVRPLLAVPKTTIIKELSKKKIPFCQDKTNQDTTYTRNLIRHEVVPVLSRINPNLLATISRTAHLMQELNSYLEKQTQLAYEQTIQSSHPKLVFSLAIYRQHDLIIRQSILRQAWAEIKGDKTDLGYERIQKADNMLLQTAGHKTIELGNHICVYKKGDRFEVFKQD